MFDGSSGAAFAWAAVLTPPGADFFNPANWESYDFAIFSN
jgi:hypothetical protein